MSERELAKTYNPEAVEEKLYKFWEDKKAFTAAPNKNKTPFTIVIPPPNVTGQLHMGHALDNTFQDILIRYKRMAGYEALWVPGTDHAGIATQIKVEEYLRQEKNLTKYDLGRDKFLKEVWAWKEKFGSRIILQLKKLGCSLDWSRLRFTMDEGCSKAVREVFVNLYEKGLIYRGHRIINWCPSCLTALSDAEVNYEEANGSFWHIKYPVKDSEEFVIIATTRPETMLGDTAVAVNPDDERYAHLIGKTLILPIMNREIPVIADEYVEKDFGTGCVKITPAHDPNDFEVGKRHNLESIKVMNDDATINFQGGKYNGQDRYEARKNIIKDLDGLGLLLKIEPHVHNVGHCYRCGTVVEPITSDQWFVKMNPLAKEAINVVENGTIKFIPDRFGKIYMNWMENVFDWCISRQLWWGHRIPAFYCDACGHMEVSKTDVEKCSKCGAPTRQEDDVLDTWFSSALWPFSTLGWPEKTEDLKYFYPTSVLVTAYDIIFFWVARMIFSGMEHMKEEPFKHVFIHGIIRDSQGRKMSKSLGNGIDPIEIIEKYGADALRHALATGNSPGNDMRFYIERVEASRNFANKLWNAARFVLLNIEDETKPLEINNILLEDKWILTKYNDLVKEVTDNLESYELGIAVQKLYDFIWDDLCDWYIELIKPRLYNSGTEKCETARSVIVYVLSNTLKLLHPFMPFITEEIWQSLPHDGDTIMCSDWPVYSEKLCFEEQMQDMGIVMDAIKAVRALRTEKNVPPSKKAKLIIFTEKTELFEYSAVFFEKLSYAAGVEITSERNFPKNAAVAISGTTEIAIPQDELINKEEELLRLEKEKQRIESELKRVQGKLSNEGFVAKAPEDLLCKEKEKETMYKEMYVKILKNIEDVLGM